MKESKKRASSKRNDIVQRLAADIKAGKARLDPFTCRLNEKVRCGVCNREGRTMVRLRYEEGTEQYLGKTCARYVMDQLHAEPAVKQLL